MDIQSEVPYLGHDRLLSHVVLRVSETLQARNLRSALGAGRSITTIDKTSGWAILFHWGPALDAGPRYDRESLARNGAQHCAGGEGFTRADARLARYVSERRELEILFSGARVMATGLKVQIWSLGRTAWAEHGVSVNICQPPQITC